VFSTVHGSGIVYMKPRPQEVVKDCENLVYK